MGLGGNPREAQKGWGARLVGFGGCQTLDFVPWLHGTTKGWEWAYLHGLLGMHPQYITKHLCASVSLQWEEGDVPTWTG